MDDSTKLIAYRYRRDGSRQRAVVLVDAVKHADPRAAVEAVLGSVGDFERIEKAPERRSRKRKTSLDAVSGSLLDQLFATSDSDTTGLRPFGSSSER